jgi:hypothetical protein
MMDFDFAFCELYIYIYLFVYLFICLRNVLFLIVLALGQRASFGLAVT